MFLKLVLLSMTFCFISCAETDINSDSSSVNWVQLDDWAEIVIPAGDGQMGTIPEYYSYSSYAAELDQFTAFLTLSCAEISKLEGHSMTSETLVLVIISATGRCGNWFLVRFEPDGFDYWIRQEPVLAGDTEGILK
ncbi:MAG: hypothetical protein VYD09_05360 [Chloroflexota bacterium]|nr:hypothetical protein [Chloroflexota bacterium]